MQKEEKKEESTQSSTTRIEVEKLNSQPTDESPLSEIEEVESREQVEIVDVQPNLSQYSLARDRRRRVIVPLARYTETNYINLFLNVIVGSNDQEPTTFEEAMSGSNSIQWIEAMNEEMHSLNVNDTWSLVLGFVP